MNALTFGHTRMAWLGATLGAIAVGLLALLQAGPRPALPVAAAGPGQQAAPAPAVAADKERALAAYGKLPLAFVPNAGQTDARVRFSAQAGGASFWFTPREAVFAFAGKRKGHVLRLGFVGANPAVQIVGRSPGAGRVNYLIGNEAAKWRTDLPTYEEIVYRDVWPGIDLAFRGQGGTLKYEFRLAPGAEAGNIRLAYRGAERLTLTRAGELRIHTSRGVLTDSSPVTYQAVEGKRIPVASRYVLAGNTYWFALGAFDTSRPLMIDPGLVYSTYLGGSGVDEGSGIAVDVIGSAYVTGRTSSLNFPTTAGAFQPTSAGFEDAFVTMLNALGAGLVYSTYLGGGDADRGLGIALDLQGQAFVTGTTSSLNFPTTAGAPQPANAGGFDAFVTKLNPTGSGLEYSTYLGGSSADTGFGIAVEPVSGSRPAYVTGATSSPNFPTTAGAFQPANAGGNDAFVTKLNFSGSALLYSTYLGGSLGDVGRAVAVETATESAHVTGSTSSGNFPTTVGAFQPAGAGGGSDAFATKLNLTGSALVYSTHLGGEGFDRGFAIALDAAGNAYLTGDTDSVGFPTTAGAFDTNLNVEDAFVTKLNAAGTELVYSTYLGGGGGDLGVGIAVDGLGNAYLTGETFSAVGFPTTAGAFQPANAGGNDAFVTKLNAAGSALVYSTLLGGEGFDRGFAIALDAAGNAFVTGLTNSADFPTTAGAFDTGLGGLFDAFVTKLDLIPAFVPARVTLSPAADTNPVGTSHTITATVKDAANNPVPNVVVRFSVTGSVSTSGSCTTGASGQCDFTYTGPALPGADAISAFADTDNDGMRDLGEPSGAAAKTWVVPASTPGCDVRLADNGRITALNGDTATFHGSATVTASGVSGTQRYEDRGPAQLTMQSINVLAVVCSPDRTELTLFGQATINGSGSFDYRIRVKDAGEPGHGVDMYGIMLSNGYVSGDKTLETGNIQIVVHA